MRSATGTWLVDVYETVLAVDFPAVMRGLAEIAGVPEDSFAAAARHVAEPTMLGLLSWPAAAARILRNCGVPPADTLVPDLAAADRRLLLLHARIFDDAHDLLCRLRAAGIPTALVSNCSEHTRHLLEHLGLDRLVDDVVLSCEVKVAKPDPVIYRTALDRLGTEPTSAVLVDDRADYCRAAVAIGMRAIQIVREPEQLPSTVASQLTWHACRDLAVVGP